MKTFNRHIGRFPDGRWTVRRSDSRRYNSLHDTKEEAIAKAQSLVDHFGGKVIIDPGVDIDPAIRKQAAKEALERYKKRVGVFPRRPPSE